MWGPGRHGPGSNTFAYFQDPNGFVAEYTTALEEIRAARQLAAAGLAARSGAVRPVGHRVRAQPPAVHRGIRPRPVTPPPVWAEPTFPRDPPRRSLVKVFTDLFIDGTWRPGYGRVAVHDPATGEVITEVATAAEAAATPPWPRRTPRCPLGGPVGEGARRDPAPSPSGCSPRETGSSAELVTRENEKVLADARARSSTPPSSSAGSPRRPSRWWGTPRHPRRGQADPRPPRAGQRLGARRTMELPSGDRPRRIGPALAAGTTSS